MEMNERSTVSYLVCTPHVPFFMLSFIGVEAKGLLAFQGRRGIASAVRWKLRPVIFGVEGYKFGCVLPTWPVQSHTNVMTGHIGTNTPK